MLLDSMFYNYFSNIVIASGYYALNSTKTISNKPTFFFRIRSRNIFPLENKDKCVRKEKSQLGKEEEKTPLVELHNGL